MKFNWDSRGLTQIWNFLLYSSPYFSFTPQISSLHAESRIFILSKNCHFLLFSPSKLGKKDFNYLCTI